MFKNVQRDIKNNSSGIFVCILLAVVSLYSVIFFFNNFKTTDTYINILKNLPHANPEKAAVILYKLQDKEMFKRLPPKMLNNLRSALLDPRSLLMTSYGTHLSRTDYINAPIFLV
uniref:Wsv136-like protein n=1 Tax=Trachysalambria curvirostris majanivirus TaxID=2984281 RepID=A0A9C7F0N7_9VIRU|nr:MAG: wsv136-like protein [Trachysalambria curvirostris majanivirus]